MSYLLHHGDCLEVMAGMEAASIDAVVCDPPYGLEFMGKSWDKLTGKMDVRQPGDANYQTPDNPHGRSKVRYGYGTSMAPMQEWHCEWAVEALRVLKPSHYLLAFGGTRTWHRLACAIEDAGFEIRDTLMWLYGSGFPKGKACLKPAWEPVILARKPGPMRELGIDECRIGYETVNGGNLADNPHLRQTIKHTGSTFGANQEAAVNPSGRWPANLVLDEEAGRELDGAAGVLTTHPGTCRSDYGAGMYGAARREGDVLSVGDSGGPSRFFYCAKASRRERNAGLEGMEARQRDLSRHADQPSMNGGEGNPYNRGAKRVQNHHPTVKPVALMRWLVRLVAQPGDVVLDPFTGSGTTGVACAKEGRDFIGIEREAEYVEIARRRIEAYAAQGRLALA